MLLLYRLCSPPALHRSRGRRQSNGVIPCRGNKNLLCITMPRGSHARTRKLCLSPAWPSWWFGGLKTWYRRLSALHKAQETCPSSVWLEIFWPKSSDPSYFLISACITDKYFMVMLLPKGKTPSLLNYLCNRENILLQECSSSLASQNTWIYCVHLMNDCL